MDESKNKTADVITISDEKKDEKYALRPRSAIKRQVTDQYQPEFIPKRPRRVKNRTTPLSKYRRKTANARERHRMKVINTAFESLRKILPGSIELCTSSSSLTKISTLRMAVTYIRSLADMLEDSDDGTDKNAPDTNSLTSEQKDPGSAETPSVYNIPQTVPSVINKNPPLRYARPSSIQYPKQLSYYISSSSHVLSSIANHPSKNAMVCPSPVRGSLSSTSDLEELLSDDSEFLEDTFDVFHDIPSIPPNDPFEALLQAEKNNSTFNNNLLK